MNMVEYKSIKLQFPEAFPYRRRQVSAPLETGPEKVAAPPDVRIGSADQVSDHNIEKLSGQAGVRYGYLFSSSLIRVFISRISWYWLSMIRSASFRTRGSDISARLLVRIAIEWCGIIAFM